MRRLLYNVKPYSIYIIIAAIASVACSVVNVKVIDILKQVIDKTTTGETAIGVLVLLLQIVAVIVVGLMSNYLVVAMTGTFGARILKDMRKDSLEHLMTISPDLMEKNNFGDLMERLSSDIEGIAGYMQTYFKDCLYVPIVVIVFAGYLISLDPMLAALCLMPLVILVPLSTHLLKPVKLSQAEYVKRLGETNNHIQEAFDGVTVIKSYNLQENRQEKYYHALKETLDLSNKNDLRQYNVLPFSEMIHEIPTAIALCVGGYLVLQGRMTLGMLVAFLSAVQKINQPLVTAYQLVVRTQMAMVSVNRVFSLMDIPSESKDESTPIEVSDTPIFTFSDVCFAYENRKGKQIIEKLNLTIKRGQRIALVGRSGSGKSTILKLLSRQYEASQGEIFYYGQKYSELTPVSVRADMALISQDAVMFPMSILDNIRIGNPDATRDEIIHAAELAGCDEFIEKMENSYDFMLEERGSNLSGGQRQRISIARAILKNASVLLLDEPTSALDRETQEHINGTIAKLAKDKTIITAAHRLSTIEDYDEIIVLDEGCIIEKGTHEVLLQNKGCYFDMYSEYTNTGGGME